jgi:hypothetical protein
VSIFGRYVIGHDQCFRLVNDDIGALYDEYGQQMATDADTEGFTQMTGGVSNYATSDKATAN